MSEWCSRISDSTGTTWRYIRIDQSKFEHKQWSSVENLVAGDS